MKILVVVLNWVYKLCFIHFRVRSDDDDPINFPWFQERED